MKRVGLVFGSLLVAAVAYYELIYALRFSGIRPFETFVVWIAPIFIYGWIFFAALWVGSYVILAKIVGLTAN
jgi:hypothetical protein